MTRTGKGSRFALRLEPLTEHQEQSDLIRRILDNVINYPELLSVFAVPNGGYRHPKTAKEMQDEGAKPGVPDLIFLHARGGYFGYVQEQKRTKGSTVSKAQKAWHKWLMKQGYCVEVRKGCEDGWQGFLEYLAEEPTEVVGIGKVRCVRDDPEALEWLIAMQPDTLATREAREKLAEHIALRKRGHHEPNP